MKTETFENNNMKKHKIDIEIEKAIEKYNAYNYLAYSKVLMCLPAELYREYINKEIYIYIRGFEYIVHGFILTSQHSAKDIRFYIPYSETPLSVELNYDGKNYVELENYENYISKIDEKIILHTFFPQ